MVPAASHSMTLYYDNSGDSYQLKGAKKHERAKHIERKYNLIRDIVGRRYVIICKIASNDNLDDPFTKALPTKSFESHPIGLGMRKI